jgi:hypothetical protein
MTVPEYLVDMDNTKVRPEPKKDHNGRTILILDTEGNPVQSGTLKIQSNLTDFTVDGLMRLHETHRKHELREKNLKAQAWAFLMDLTEIHHRDLITKHIPTQDISAAWTDIKAYFEGASQQAKHAQLKLLMKTIPKSFSHLERNPTCQEISAIISAIVSVVTKFTRLEPPVTITDFDKKSLFIESLPACCDNQIEMLNSAHPDLTFTEITERWLSSKYSVEFKEAARHRTEPRNGSLRTRPHK